ncbi:MAG: hypothetical protein PSV46_25300 [Reyranella sp.]|nr:hypothetical protein [Reyranella sp.]
MVEHQAEAGIALGDLVSEMHVFIMEQHHRRDAGLLHFAPHPVEATVDQRLAQNVGMKREAHAKHARLLPPAGDLAASIRRIGIEAAHDGEAIRMLGGGFEGNVVAVAFPRRRHQDHAVDTGLVHFGQQFILAEWRPVRLGAGGPRTLRRVGGPDVNLCVDDHQVNSPRRLTATATNGG